MALWQFQLLSSWSLILTSWLNRYQGLFHETWNPGYKPKPGYINPVLYSLVHSVPLKPSDAQNGQIWRARIMKPRLQARARIPCKTHFTDRWFLERDQSRRLGEASKSPGRKFQQKAVFQQSATPAHKLIRGSHGHGNNLKQGNTSAINTSRK